MTREEKITAFTMRLDGYTCREIGERMGCTGENVSDSLRRVLNRRRPFARCIYPEITRWMRESGTTAVRLAEAVHYSPDTVYAYLGGYSRPSEAFEECLEQVTGIGKEILFQPLGPSGGEAAE